MSNTVSELTADHQGWLNQIRGWETELQSLEEINGSIAVNHENKDIRKQVEHWQNAFIVQKQRLDQMKHNIKLYGGDVAKGSSEINDYASYYNNLKNEFSSFSGNLS